ncbi:hypothetical protein ACQ4PT_045547 [Festuca glaucescens]
MNWRHLQPSRLNVRRPLDVLDTIHCQIFRRLPTVVPVHQDYCTSPQRLVTHLPSHWCAQASPKVRSALSIHGGSGFNVYRSYHYETVPYTNRTHAVFCSAQRARNIIDPYFADYKKEHASEIIDPKHHESVRVRDIALRIVPAINRGLAIKRKKSQGGEASSQKMTVRLDWVDKLNWEVIVVEDKRIRAECFAGGGKIIVSTRILDLFRTDDEIAAILAHEVGHVIARHSCEIKLFVDWFPIRLLATTFLRRNELEADYLGMLLLAAAGFDPHGAPLFYDKMGKINGESLLTNFLSCILFQVHPSSKKRSRLLLQPKVMEEAMELYREVTSDGQGYDKDLDPLN